MALAGDQQRIARLKCGDTGADRLVAVADFLGALGSGENGGADRSRILAARIVVGDDHAVGVLCRDRAHQRTLSRVAIAACAEHDDELAFRIRPQRLQCLGQRVRLVRVVDEHRRAVALADALQPALGAFELLDAGENLFGVAAGADGKAGGDQRILDLEFADQRQS